MENRVQIGMKLPPELLRELDQFCEEQIGRPTRTGVVEDAIRMFLTMKRAQPVAVPVKSNGNGHSDYAANGRAALA